MIACDASSKTASALGLTRADQPQAGPRRVLQLDILRGLAVLLVLFRHPAIGAQHARSRTCERIATALYTFGWTGVDLFFVLSGFLIGGLLFREIRLHGRLDVRRFLVRRGFKIWPSYFLLIAVAMAADAYHAGWHHAWIVAWPNWVHLQNYVFPPSPNPMLRGQTWSLAVEEHFYLVLPIILLLAPLRRRDGKVQAIPLIPWLALAVSILCLGLRLHNWGRTYHDWTNTFPTHLRMDGLLFGVLLAYVFNFYPATLARIGTYRKTLMLVGLALVLPMMKLDLNLHPFVSTIGFTMLYLGYGCILVAVTYTRPGDGWLGWLIATRAARALAFMGVFSYAIYLWRYDLAQAPFTYVFERVLPYVRWMPGPIYYGLFTLIYLVWCTAAGVLVTKLIEGPGLRLRDWLFPARARAFGTQAPAEMPVPPADLKTSGIKAGDLTRQALAV